MKKSVYTILALFMLFSTQAQNKKTLKKGVIQDVENQKKELNLTIGSKEILRE